MYQGLSRPKLRLRFASTAGGTALSLRRNGLPLIARIIQNVMKMTSKMIGIVQSTRRTTNFSIRGPAFRETGGGAGDTPPLQQLNVYETLTCVRSISSIGFVFQPWTF